MNNYTNAFKITNLNSLKTNYTLFTIKSEFPLKESDKQKITKKLSYKHKHPFLIINYLDKPHLVARNEPGIEEKLKEVFKLVGNKAFFTPTGEGFELDFANPSDETKKICLRFLQFGLQGYLKPHRELWQPGSGRPYYSMNGRPVKGVNIHRGFRLRVIELPNNKFGIRIDATRKKTSISPLDKYLDRQTFLRYHKGKTFLYKYGLEWYEVKPKDFSDFTVGDIEYEKGGKSITLLEDLRNQNKTAHSPELIDLPSDASVLVYETNNKEKRSIPAGLCYRVYDSEDIKGKSVHRESVLNPPERLPEILFVRHHFLNNLKFDKQELKIAALPLEIETSIFNLPDYEFGNNFILKGSEIGLHKIGKSRLETAINKNIGFYSNSVDNRFRKQYFVLPQSVYNKMGKQFLEELRVEVNKLFPSQDGYNPEIVIYEDVIGKNKDYINIGLNIVKAVENQISAPNQVVESFCVVMLPELKKKKRKHDELAALVVAELNNLNIRTSIIHNSVVEKSYYPKTRDGITQYFATNDRKQSGILKGYIRNVAIVKVLLNNHKFPFCLATPLHADLTIGIDVKHHTAGFTYIDKYAKNIQTSIHESKDKEQLSQQTIFNQLLARINAYIKAGVKIENIVIHRDGRLFESEMKGIEQVHQYLVKKGVKSITVVEIQKSTLSSARIFKAINKNQKLERISNPTVGTYHFSTESTAILCSTGKENLRNGTAKPLVVNNKISFDEDLNPMDFVKVLEDLYHLTTLTFTKLDSGLRLPITIKLTDLKLRALASEYKENEYRQEKVLIEILNS